MDDFHAVFSFCNKIFTGFGFNFSKRTLSNGRIVYKICFVNVLYSVLLIILWSFLEYINIVYKVNPATEGDVLNYLFNLVTNVTGFFASFGLILTSVFNSKKYCSLLNTFRLDFLDINDYKHVKKMFLVHFAVLMVIMFSTYFFSLWAFSDQLQFHVYNLDIFFYIFVWMLFSIYSTAYSCQFFLLSKWLAIHFQKLNDKMEKIEIDEMTEGNHIEKFKFEENKLFVSSEFKKFLSFDSNDLARIQISELRKIHHEVLKMCQIVNEYFSTGIMILLAENFFLTLLFIYCGLRLLIEFSDYFWATTAEVFNVFSWGFLHFGFVIYLINSGERVHFEVDKTKKIVSELLNTTENPEIKAELVIFAAQTKNEKFRFSPHGFFDLDKKLLFSMISSGIAYLVILIQFYVAFYNEQREKKID